MRSLLVQASSVERAVEKAWANAGMPTEFTIKILDFGKKGFLGMTKKPAIISIMFEPKKQTAIAKQQPKRQTQKPKQQPPRKEKRTVKKYEKKPTPTQEKTFWTDSLIYEITSWLTEMTKIIGISSSFKVKTYKKQLTITFDREIFPSQEDERLLFSGLSYLLIQFLKKKHKKKYQGYKLMLTSKRS